MVLDVIALSWLEHSRGTCDSAPGLAVMVPAFRKGGGNLCSNYSGISFQYLGILSTSEGTMEREV